MNGGKLESLVKTLLHKDAVTQEALVEILGARRNSKLDEANRHTRHNIFAPRNARRFSFL